MRKYFVVIWSFWLVFATINFLNYSDDNPFKLTSPIIKDQVKMFLPQGWAFFTRDAREDVIVIYNVVNNIIVKNDEKRQASYLNFFGLKRNARAFGIDLAWINDKLIDHSNYHKIYPSLDSVGKDIVNGKFQPVNIFSNQKHPLLMGHIIIVKKKVTPWAWSSNYDKISFPIDVIYVNILKSEKN